MDINAIWEDLGDATVELVLDKTVTTDQRRTIGDLLGIDLCSEWRIDAEYLAKKTTGEMLVLGETLGIFADPAAEAFLKETLGRRSFKACKKGVLARVFLDSGADLAGKVPAEILGTHVKAALKTSSTASNSNTLSRNKQNGSMPELLPYCAR